MAATIGSGIVAEATPAAAAPDCGVVMCVSDWATLSADFAANDSIALSQDITYTSADSAELLKVPTTGAAAVTLDLNGFTLDIGTTNALPVEAAGIEVPPSTTLTIQDTAGGGRLTVTAQGGGAGIGGYGSNSDVSEGAGSITVSSGTVTAVGGGGSGGGAGIGGGGNDDALSGGSGGSVTVAGGSVTATGGGGGAGIGGGGGGDLTPGGPGGSLTVTAGSVVATGGGGGGAGVGGGGAGDLKLGGFGAIVLVSAGSLTATGGSGGQQGAGAGIGGGGGGGEDDGGNGDMLTVTGGTVTATGGGSGSASGGGAGVGGGGGGADGGDGGGVPAVSVAAGSVIASGGTSAGGDPGDAIGGAGLGSGMGGGSDGDFGSLDVAGQLTFATAEGIPSTVTAGTTAPFFTVEPTGVVTVETTLSGSGVITNDGTILPGPSGSIEDTLQGSSLTIDDDAFDLSFDVNGGPGLTPSSMVVYADDVHNADRSLPTVSAPAGQSFAGWYSAADSSGTRVANKTDLVNTFGDGPISEELFAHYVAFGPPPPPPSPPSITVASSENPSSTGDSVTFTATLSPPPSCGTVTWLVDSQPVSDGTAGSNGVYTLGPLSSLPVGSDPVTATFSGCASAAAESGTVVQQVNQPASSPPPPGVTDPTITAKVTSAHVKRHGWYRSPVHVSFSCTAGSSALATPCPDPVTLSKSKANQSVSASVSDSDGGAGSVTVTGINIDR
ncbi:MAG TPA: Ig-like domain-containing protein, partial [Mycobacteriales bacterium]|nr:Ig-like domain-containing protein [Mycobacteriales bacterium]